MKRSQGSLVSSFFLIVVLLLLHSVSSFQPTISALSQQKRKTGIIRQQDAASTNLRSVVSSNKLPDSSSFSDDLQRRLLADPNFIKKSITEIILAAITQLIAEVGRRGKHRILPEIDFVLAGLLTAVAGKYYSMWKVAPTSIIHAQSITTPQITITWWERVPTNAFQDVCLDGSTPTILLRLFSFIKPIPSLFRAGFISSFLGYGSTAIIITLRSYLLPSYMSQTQNVNILTACIYTGCFLATVSNVRYQLLSGVVEPKIIHRFFKDDHPKLHGLMVFAVRLANGFLGSFLAIAGMRWLGLQKLKP